MVNGKKGYFEGSVKTEIEYIKKSIERLHEKFDEHFVDENKTEKSVAVIKWVQGALISWATTLTGLIVYLFQNNGGK